MRMWSFDEEKGSLNKAVDRLGSRRTVVKRISSRKDKCPALHWDNAKSALRKRPYPTRYLTWSNIEIHLEGEIAAAGPPARKQLSGESVTS